IVITNGVDHELLGALQDAVAAVNGTVELIAPTVGGLKDSAGNPLVAQQRINGGPSVLYDAVALLPTVEGANALRHEATMRDFIADAFAHAKFIAHNDAAELLLAAAGLHPKMRDEGVIALESASDADTFIQTCGALRLWAREGRVHSI
ncbi:MAG: catalase HPII, partial [Komagataeibacter saccharivorans]